MTISKEIEIDMSHRLINHKGLCKNFHGHRYKFEVSVSGELYNIKGDSCEGMVLDFSDLKKVMVEIIENQYDHSMMITKADDWAAPFSLMKIDGMRVNFVDYISTVENIGKDVFKQLETHLTRYCIKLVQLRVWETPTSCATITQEDVKE